MKTYILFWNPAISSYKLENFQEEMEELGDAYMNWSVWEYENASAGDRFFMVRCGEGNTGICMSGYFSSDPYQDEDWSGRGRVTYYMDLDADVMIHPDYRPILKTETLLKEIPEFDWKGGHSGRVIDATLAEKLEILWKKFLDENAEIFETRAATQEIDLNDYKSKNDDKQEVTITFMHDGSLTAYSYLGNMEIYGDDLNDIKKKATDKVYEYTGKKPEVTFEYTGVDNENIPLFEKTLNLVLAKKKKGQQFEQSYWDFNTKVAYLLHEVSISAEEIKSRGFPKEVVKTLEVLERRKAEDFVRYVKRVAKDESAKDIINDKIEATLYINDRESIDIEDVKMLNENLEALRYLRSLD